MIEALLKTNKTKFILIIDSVENKGLLLLKSLLFHRLQGSQEVHLVLYETLEHTFTKDLHDFTNLKVHQEFIDPLGWLEIQGPHRSWSLNKWHEEVKPSLGSVTVVDSFTCPAMSASPAEIYSFLSKFLRREKSETLIAVAHGDVSDGTFLSSLKTMATTVISILHSDPSGFYKTNISVRAPRRKPFFSEEEFTISAQSYQLLSSKITKLDPKNNDILLEETSSLLEECAINSNIGGQGLIHYHYDKDDDLDEDEPDEEEFEEVQCTPVTFKVEMTPEEIEAHRNVVLPFQRNEEVPSGNTNEESSDEDPDADLDI